MASNSQRYQELMARLEPEFRRKWRADKGLAGNSKDSRRYVVDRGPFTYLLLERLHTGASGRFSTTSVHRFNPTTRQLDFVEHVGSYDLARTRYRSLKLPTPEEYDQARKSLLLSYAPAVYPCKKCGWPVLKGYVCGICGDTQPDTAL